MRQLVLQQSSNENKRHHYRMIVYTRSNQHTHKQRDKKSQSRKTHKDPIHTHSV